MSEEATKLRSLKTLLIALAKEGTVTEIEELNLYRTIAQSSDHPFGSSVAEYSEVHSEHIIPLFTKWIQKGLPLPWKLHELEVVIIRDFYHSDPTAMITMYDVIRQDLLHPEPRMRATAISLFPKLVVTYGLPFFIMAYDLLVDDIRKKIVTRVVLEKKIALGGTSEMMALDATTGWDTLETSIQGISYLIQAASDHLLVLPMFKSEDFRLLISDTSKHISRHIVQAGLTFVETVLKAHFPCVSDDVYILMRDSVALGLENDWTQIRYAASVTARALLLSADMSDHLKQHHASLLFPLLLPRICMNRFYAAEGVKNYSLETWKITMNMSGKERLSSVISDVTQFYIYSTYSANHMVAEAALAAISEIVSKLPGQIVYPYLDGLMEAVVQTLRSDSWPVRDAACLTAGIIVRHFPDVAVDIASLLQLYCIHLQDSISSVRFHAAEGIGEMLRLVSFDDKSHKVRDVTLEAVKTHLNLNLNRAKSQIQKKKTSFLSPVDINAMKQLREKEKSTEKLTTVFSLLKGNNTMLQEKKKLVGWGCGIDCAVGVDCSALRLSGECDWEASDGCIYLVKEIAPSFPCVAEAYIDDVLNLLRLDDFKDCHRLHTTIYSALGDIFESFCTHLGRRSEEHLNHAFLLSLSKDSLNATSSLKRDAARMCANKLCSLLGMQMFISRIPESIRKEMASLMAA